LKVSKITWIGFLVTLSALSIPSKTVAHETNSVSKIKPQTIENRLSRIAETLKQRENQWLESTENTKNLNPQENTKMIAGWVNIGGGGFANRGGGGGFVNRGGGGGFVNRGWRDGGGFLNRRY
jgi:rSAM-associated Gly-rich repeat protein